jgi:hypothetical protein
MPDRRRLPQPQLGRAARHDFCEPHTHPVKRARLSSPAPTASGSQTTFTDNNVHMQVCTTPGCIDYLLLTLPRSPTFSIPLFKTATVRTDVVHRRSARPPYDQSMTTAAGTILLVHATQDLRRQPRRRPPPPLRVRAPRAAKRKVVVSQHRNLPLARVVARRPRSLPNLQLHVLRYRCQHLASPLTPACPHRTSSPSPLESTAVTRMATRLASTRVRSSGSPSTSGELSKYVIAYMLWRVLTTACSDGSGSCVSVLRSTLTSGYAAKTSRNSPLSVIRSVS